MKRTLSVLSLVFAILLLLVACGPAGTNLDSAAENPASNLPPLSSEGETNESPLLSTPNPTEAQPIENLQTDAKGIPVGYTEDGHPFRGNPNASVVMLEFSDFQCPFCARFHTETMPTLDNNQIANGEVLLIYYDFPLNNLHPQAAAASNAARCAGEQNVASFWAMHDVLYANQAAWSVPNSNAVFSQFGRNLGLEMEQFDNCLASNKYAAEIEADLAIGTERGVDSTPTFFLNDQPLLGAQPLAAFNQAITAVQNGQPIVSNQPATQPTADPALRITPAAISTDAVAATLGNPAAPVTIVEYTDYQCPFCLRHSTQTLPQMIQNMIETGLVYYVLKDFPLESIHPEARIAAVAVRCAGEQEAYWQMHDAVFNTQEQWGNKGNTAAKQTFVGLADELQLDTTAYATCLDSGKFEAAITASLTEGGNLGINGTPHFYINGFPVSGAQPYELFDYAVNLAQEGTLADAYTYQPEATATPVGPATVQTADAYSVGAADAPVTIVEFTDFQCPYCYRHFQQTFPQLMEEYINTGQVRYVFKDFPLTSIHPQAFLASEAARCAGEQGAYLEMHSQLFTAQQEWNGRNDADALFVGYAGALSLDVEQFSNCLSSHKYEDAVQADINEGFSLGISGTPAFFLNGYSLFGAQPYNIFQQAITQLLAQ